MLRAAPRLAIFARSFSATPARTMATWSRLVRFQTSSSSTVQIGEPVNSEDVGLATYKGEPVEVELYDGKSILSPGQKTGEKVKVERLLSPLAEEEVGTIRCKPSSITLCIDENAEQE